VVETFPTVTISIQFYGTSAIISSTIKLTYIQKSRDFLVTYYEGRGEIGLSFCARKCDVGASVDNHLPLFATRPW